MGQETIPPACSEGGRTVVQLSALAFFSVLQAPLPSYSRPGPLERMLCNVGFRAFEERGSPEVLAYATAPDFSQNLRNPSPVWPSFKKKIFFNIYSFLRVRETEHEQEKGRERGRHRIRNRLQALNGQPRARCRAGTHGLQDHDLSRSRDAQPTEPPRHPPKKFFLKEKKTS